MNKYIVADCCRTVAISLGGLGYKKKKSKWRKNKLKTMWKNKAWVSFTGVLVLSGDFLFLKFVVPCVKLTQ